MIFSAATGLKLVKLGAVLVGIGAAVVTTGVIVGKLSKEAKEEVKEITGVEI